jgi:WD40 repeat protein
LGAWAFPPDGTTVVTAGRDRLLRYWDISSGRLLRTAPGPDWVPALSPDGRLVAGYDAGKIQVWDTRTGKRVAAVPLKVPGDRLAFVPGGRTLLSWGGSDAQLIDWPSGRTRKFDDVSLLLAVSPDGRWLVDGGTAEGRPVRVLDRATGREVVRVGFAGSPAVSPDGRRLAVVGPAGTGGYELRLFGLPGGKGVARFKVRADFGCESLSFSPDGKLLALGGAFEGLVLDPASGRTVCRLPGRANRPAFSPDGRIVAAAAGSRLRLFDAATGREIHPEGGDLRIKLGESDVALGQARPAVSPDGRLLAAVDPATRGISVWDLTDGRLVRRLPLRRFEDIIDGLAFRPDGRALAAFDGGRTVRTWDTESWRARDSVLVHGLPEPAINGLPGPAVVLAPDGLRLVGWDPGASSKDEGFTRLAVWDAGTGKMVSRFRIPGAWNGLPIAWSPGGSAAVLEGRRGLAVVGVTDGRVRGTVPGSCAPGGRVGVSADGRLVAAWEDGPAGRRVVVREVLTGREVAAVPAGKLVHLAFGRGGRVLVADDDRRGLRAFDLATGREPVRFAPPVPPAETYGLAEGLVVTADGRRAVAVVPDGTAVVWDLGRATPAAGPTDLRRLWEDLGAADAGRAWRAVWRLAEAPPGRLVPFLRERLRPLTPADEAAVRKLVAGLGADHFAAREEASKALLRKGREVAPLLRGLLRQSRSPEARRRLRAVLDKLDKQPPTPGMVRTERAVAALEQVRAPTARQLLEELVNGAGDGP